MFDARGRPKKLIELGDNEAAVIAVFEVSEKLLGHDHTKKLKRTYKLKFVDGLGAFALLAKACHYYADRQEQTGPDDGAVSQNLTVKFVDASLSPEEAYRPRLSVSYPIQVPAKAYPSDLFRHSSYR